MTDLVKRAFTENLGLKALAVLLALVVFVIVRADRDAVSGGFVAVDYNYPTTGEWILTSKPVRQLRISVRGRWSKVNRFDDRKIPKIAVRIQPANRVVVNFQPSMIKGIPRGIRVVAITPPSVELTFEKAIEAKINLKTRIIGEVARGYRLDGLPQLEPATFMLRGAKSAIEKLVKTGLLLAPVDVTRAEGPVKKVVKLAQPLPKHVTAMTTPSVRVTQKVSARQGERALPDVAIDAIGINDPKFRVELDQSTASVFLKGALPVLNKLDPSKITVQLDLKRFKKSMATGVQAVSVEIGPKNVKGLPKKIKVAAVRPALIKVRFIKEPIQ